MKKLICVILSVLLAVSCSSYAFAYPGEDSVISEYPVIMVAGYSSSALRINNGDGTYKGVWGLDFDEVGKLVLSRIADIGRGIGRLTLGDAQYIADVVGKEVVNLCGALACNPDGTSVYNIENYYYDAEHCNSQWLIDNMDGAFRGESVIMDNIASYVGQENIYSFNCDFRMGAEHCANQLDKFIDSVLDYTGAEKVNIFAVSHGGQVTATYLAMHTEDNHVHNAVFTVPAIGGAGFGYDALSGNAILDEEELMVYIQSGMLIEEDYNWLLKAEKLGFLDDIIDGLLPYCYEVLGYWGSMWDFVPAKYYEDVKASRLDAVESARLIEISDRFHYEILPKIGENLRLCQDNGTNITIIAGCGNTIVTGLQENSDAIITLNASTGALCADWGKRFNDGYTGCKTVCSNPAHNHISPDMEIDATCAYLPEDTFFVKKFFHGMSLYDSYVDSLMMSALLTDEIQDIRSSPKYPQFKNTQNLSFAVDAAFDRSASGYLCENDSELVLTNLSEKYKLKIISISVNGTDLSFKNSFPTINIGESASIAIASAIPEVSVKNFEITVNYAQIGSITTLGTRTFDFMLMNGPAVEYDAENPLTDASYPDAFNDTVTPGMSKLLSAAGLTEFFSMLFNTLRALFENIRLVTRGFC